MAVKFYTSLFTAHFVLDDGYQLQLRIMHTGTTKKTELFVTQSGKFEDLLQGICIFQEIDEDCKSKLTDYPECVHKYLLDPKLCIDQYLAKKKTK